MSFDAEMVETNRLAGVVTFNWNAVAGVIGYDLLDNEANLMTNVTSPLTVTGLQVNTSHSFKVAARVSGGAFQSRNFPFQYGENEFMDVAQNSSDAGVPY